MPRRGRPAVPEPPELPNNLDRILRWVLPTGEAATEAAVRAAVDNLKLHPAARRDVASAGDVIGVALSIPPVRLPARPGRGRDVRAYPPAF